MNTNTTAALLTRTRTGTDEFGAAVYTETATVLDGIFWPAGSSEARNGQDQVSWSDTLCLPADTDVAAVDAVIPQVVLDADGNPVLDGNGKVQGDPFEVNGKPTVWPANPFSGNTPDYPVVVELRRVTG